MLLISWNFYGGRTRARTWDPLIKSCGHNNSSNDLLGKPINIALLAINNLQIKWTTTHLMRARVKRASFGNGAGHLNTNQR